MDTVAPSVEIIEGRKGTIEPVFRKFYIVKYDTWW